MLHPDHFGTVAGFVLVIAVFFFAYALCILVGAELVAWREGLRPAARDILATLAADAPKTPPAAVALVDDSSGASALLPGATPAWQESGRAS